jgi:hypothetical protein
MRKMALESVPSWLMWSLGAGVCIFSSLVLMLYKHQSRLLYFPQFPEGSNLRYDATPADYGLGYEDCYLNTSDGAVVHLWLIKQQEEPLASPPSSCSTATPEVSRSLRTYLPSHSSH